MLAAELDYPKTADMQSKSGTFSAWIRQSLAYRGLFHKKNSQTRIIGGAW
jgi:hypothetical protein